MEYICFEFEIEREMNFGVTQTKRRKNFRMKLELPHSHKIYIASYHQKDREMNMTEGHMQKYKNKTPKNIIKTDVIVHVE